jgi:pimeloyl-ACP methyl ester carboxylesterase
MMGWLLLIVVVVLGVPAAAYLAQDRMLFLPRLAAPPRSVRPPRPVEEIAFATDEGPRVRGWLAPARRGGPAPLIVYYGGNAEDVTGQAFEPWPADWSLALVNYRGYGASEGHPSERALCADALVVLDALARRPDVDPTRIVLVGRSLGTGVATQVAGQRPVQGVVVISPYDSMVALSRYHYPRLPVRWLLRHRFDSVARAPGIKAPLLAIAAERDTIIPPERSRRLHAAWGGPKRWVLIADAGHNDLGRPRAFWEPIRAFLETARAGRAALDRSVARGLPSR